MPDRGTYSHNGKSPVASKATARLNLSSSYEEGRPRGACRHPSCGEPRQALETSTALQGANQTIGTLVFNAATANTSDADFLTAQAPGLNRWYAQQSQVAPAQFLSQARQNRIITAQQYQALARDPRAQAEFAEAYKLQLNAISERDALGNLTPEGLGRAAHLRSGLENPQVRNLRAGMQTDTH